ncbi:hypothetical protein [Mycolicibacter kumamotonensis]|uniref:hypothetical protein n=1 Tax=Mycolicibacter kumamotonensis TaxID=354243 RepID=UPI0010427BC6|nr:hypothetical protein [Mycolicibacter kumamotonensis]
MSTVNGVSDAQATARALRAQREMAQCAAIDPQRIEHVCAALRRIPGMSDHFKAQLAKTILNHPTSQFIPWEGIKP